MCGRICTDNRLSPVCRWLVVSCVRKSNKLCEKRLDAKMKNNTQNNSVFARIWRSKYQRLYGTAWFLLMYLMLLCAGGSFFVVAILLGEYMKKWASFLVVGLIILASALLTKQFQDWSRDVKKRGETGDSGAVEKGH